MHSILQLDKPLTRSFFFFNDTATTEIYTLSLHDALPISRGRPRRRCASRSCVARRLRSAPDSHTPGGRLARPGRSEEHTSELQSLTNLVCRLLLEKKKQGRRQLHRRRTHSS